MNKLKEALNKLLKNEQFIKYQPILLPSASGLICLLLLFLVAIPQFLKLQSNQKGIKEIESKITFYKQKTETLSRIEAETYKSNISAALVALPDDRDIPGIIGNIQSAVGSSGLTLDGLSFANSTATNSLNNYLVRTQVSGDINSIKRFISIMQESARVVKLGQLDFAGGVGSKLQANIDFITYFQPLPNIITSVDQEVPSLTEKDIALLDKIKGYAPAPATIDTPAVNTPTSGTTPGTALPESTVDGPGKADPFK